jgi:peptidoglycan/LPS O-acetylase OafA/YrhL
MSSSARRVYDESAEKRGAFYRPGLDVLRAVAFLLVFVAHGFVGSLDQHTQLGALGRSGEFGVGVFFFLSSYLITELLLREKQVSGTVQIPAFYARRVLRIWPLYFAMIAIFWLYGFVSPSHSLSLAWGLSLLLLFTNWYTVGHGYPPGFLYPLWSLSIEEQFYLAWPFLVKYLSPRQLLKVSAGIIAVSYLTLLILLRHGQSLDPAVWANGLVQFQFFALGTLLAILVRGRRAGLGTGTRVVFFFAGLLCLRGAQAAVYVNDPVLAHTFATIAPRFLIALCGCVFLFFSCLDISAGRLQKPWIYLGKISYGLYVFHVLWLGLTRNVLQHFAGSHLSALAFQLTVMAVALPATVITAALSYRYLESPFLRLKEQFTVVTSRPVEALVPMAVRRMPRPRLKAS